MKSDFDVPERERGRKSNVPFWLVTTTAVIIKT